MLGIFLSDLQSPFFILHNSTAMRYHYFHYKENWSTVLSLAWKLANDSTTCKWEIHDLKCLHTHTHFPFKLYSFLHSGLTLRDGWMVHQFTSCLLQIWIKNICKHIRIFLSWVSCSLEIHNIVVGQMQQWGLQSSWEAA